MTKQQMSLVLEDTAINLSEAAESFECSEQELSNFNAELALQPAGDVRVVSVVGVRLSSEMDSGQDGMWIATLGVSLIVEADPLFFSKVEFFSDIPELGYFKETILDAISGPEPYEFSGSWYLREMNKAPEPSVDPVGFAI